MNLGLLPTEGVNPRSADMDLLSTGDLVAMTLRESRAAFDAATAAAPAIAELADLAAAGVAAGGRIVYAGAGTSGRLALLDAVELAPTFGFARDRAPVLLAGGERAVHEAVEGAEDDAAAGDRAATALGLRALDTVVGVAASGRTPFVAGVLAAATRAGATTGVVACAAPSNGVAARVVVLLHTGPEVLQGSTRMNAGTATKLALNAFSLAVMVRLGKVHGNRMVDVRATNEKLRDRAERLVEDLGGVTRDVAQAHLAASGGHAKTAVVMARLGIGADEARARLDAARGHLREVIGRGAARDSAGPGDAARG